MAARSGESETGDTGSESSPAVSSADEDHSWLAESEDPRPRRPQIKTPRVRTAKVSMVRGANRRRR